MHEFNWNALNSFLEVVRSGSVTKAAKVLRVNQTTISRQISGLEQHLEATLFDRTSPGWSLTPAGQRILDPVSSMADQANEVRRLVFAESTAVKGMLRITSSTLFLQRFLTPALKDFADAYPDVSLELIADDDLLDLTRRDADVAFRATLDPPPDTIAKRVAHIAYAIYCSRSLYEKLKAKGNLAQIPVIAWADAKPARPRWIDRNFPDTRMIYRVNTESVMLESVRQGLGAAQITCAAGNSDPGLVRLPASYVDPGWDLWMLWHQDARNTPRVRVFCDFMLERLAAQRDLIEGTDTQFEN